MSDQMPPAGWYPDPDASAPAGQRRFWDGSAWTEHTTAPTTTTPTAAPSVAAEQPNRQRRYLRWLLPTLIGLVAFLFGVGVGAAGDADTTQTAEPEPAATVTITATPGAVPQNQLDALAARESALDQREAQLDQREAGLDSREAALAEQEQALEAPPAPEPNAVAPEPANECHPSYDPCVPIASDLDCEGGSGNGPVYTGRVLVIGPDEYGLDDNGDGIGCEQS
jgi:hypothetical protein